MKKTVLMIALSIGGYLTISAQTFTVLATDPGGDNIDKQLAYSDAKTLSYAVDASIDSLWFRIESYYAITGDFGYAIGIDGDLDPTNGGPWGGLTNTSMKYDRKIRILNNSFFPPTYADIEGAMGNMLPGIVHVKLLDSKTIEINVKLSAIDADGKFNVIAATKSFDGGSLYDDIPNTGFATVGSTGAG